jgi:tetratricopeptide (TPR) repeat protein
MSGISKPVLILAFALVSGPFSLLAADTATSDEAASAAPLLPSIVTPGRPRGSLYLEQGQVSDALRDFESAVRVNPDDASALTNRAQAYCGFGRMDETLADLDRAVVLDPDLIAARFNRGAMLYEKGEMDKALGDFNHCIAVDPHAPGPYFNRAAVYDAMGKRAEAVADLNRFMELTDKENWKQWAQDILKVWADKDKVALIIAMHKKN